MKEDKSYLEISNADDLKIAKERRLYRFFEIIPGALSLLTLSAVIFGSWLFPVYIAIFIIVFDVYWLLKTFFLSLHLRSGFNKMQENLKINWLEKLAADCGLRTTAAKNWKEIYHLIILPFFDESYEVIESSVKSLLAANYPKNRFIVVLAAEEKAGENAQKIANKISEKYSKEFFKFLITTHPEKLEGEIPGKGSNETWAAKQAKKEIIDPLKINYEDIIVSVFDSDTQAFPEYFGCLAYNYLTAENPFRSSFQPIPLFHNNIWDAPAFSRVAGTSCAFWQIMQQVRPERLATFSSQSIGFKQLAEMDFWNVKNVSEDSRIFWKALLFYNGDYKVVPLYYPVSMDANLAPTLWQTIVNVYKQQRRWGWGVENVPYFLFGSFKNKNFPLFKKIKHGFNHIEGFWSWGTNALMIFLLGWLPVLIGGPEFKTTALAYNLPKITRALMALASIGLISSAIYAAILLPPKPAQKPKHKYIFMVLQWALLPVIMIIFGCIPGLEAQIRLMLGGKFRLGFWVTPKHRKDKENEVYNDRL